MTRTIMHLLASSAVAVALPSLAAAQTVEGDIVSLDGWTYDHLYEQGTSIEELLDADVDGPTGEDIGRVENVLFSAEGEALSVIAEVGGFLDIGDTHVSVPWEEVEIDADADTVVLPVTQETVEEYTLFTDDYVTLEDTQEIEEVGGNGWGTVDAGPRVWRAAELIGDYARLNGGETPVAYGYVDDIVVVDGAIEAVVVSPDVTWGTPGTYAYPYYGTGYGWGPAYDYYDLPYTEEDIVEMEPFEDELLDS